MAKGGWLKGLTSSNRFWGIVLIVAGSGIALIPGLQVIGGTVVAGGIGQFSVGLVSVQKRKVEEEAGVKDKAESKIN